jgi:hypothetical protein
MKSACMMPSGALDENTPCLAPGTDSVPERVLPSINRARQIVRELSANWVQNGAKPSNSQVDEFSVLLGLDGWSCLAWAGAFGS